MIDLTPLAAASLLNGSQRRFIRVESWYDDRLLHDDIPVAAGREEVDRGSNVPERVTLSVPRFVGGYDFAPSVVDSPLAANGQMIRVLLGIGLGVDRVEWITRGWFVIESADPNEETVEVQAAGLLYKIQEAGLINPYQPKTTMMNAIRQLVEPAITCDFDAALVDRAVPANANYDQDRLGALNLTLAAWPAIAEVTNEGYLYVSPGDDMTTPVLDLTSDRSGTIMSRSGSSTRQGVYNTVVAQGTKADGGIVRGVAYDTGGPKRVGGPFNELPVPLYFDSPLITTAAIASASAKTRLRTLKRNTAVTYDVKMVPHPAIQAGDLITIDGSKYIVEQFALPYTAGGGEMTMKVRVV